MSTQSRARKKYADRDDIIRLRKACGLTADQAAQLIHRPKESWVDWERGRRKMDLSLFELFVLKLANIHDIKTSVTKSDSKTWNQIIEVSATTTFYSVLVVMTHLYAKPIWFVALLVFFACSFSESIFKLVWEKFFK